VVRKAPSITGPLNASKGKHGIVIEWNAATFTILGRPVIQPGNPSIEVHALPFQAQEFRQWGHSLAAPGCVERSPWDPTRFLSLVLGEIERIRNDEEGYGPRGRGYLVAEDIPQEVLASYESIIARAPGRWSPTRRDIG